MLRDSNTSGIGAKRKCEAALKTSLVIRAIVNAARSVRILNRMTAEEAKLPKIGAEDRRLYLRVSRDKVNLVPAGKAMWVHLVD